MYFKPGYPQQQQLQQQQQLADVSYNRSRLQLTPNSNFAQQKGSAQYTVKNTRRDTTPSKEAKDFFHHPKSNQKLKQFPVQMQHIRLNQLEENYASQHQQVDMTPQRHLAKGAAPNSYNQNFIKHQQGGSISQLHNSTEMNKINVNLSLKQFQQHPLKQVNQSSSQKTPMGSSSKVHHSHNHIQTSHGQQYHQVQEDPQQSHQSNQKFGREANPNDLQQQVQDLRRQKENICITLSETFKKNQNLNIQVQELQRQLTESEQQHLGDLDALQDKVIELTNANTNLSAISSQYSVKLSQLESQVRQNRLNDLKKIQELTDEATKSNHDKNEYTTKQLYFVRLQEEAKQLRKNRNEVLEMNQCLEHELKEAGEQYTALQNESTFLQQELQELYTENQSLKETSKTHDPAQVKELMEGQKVVAHSILGGQKNLLLRMNDSIDTDISDHHSMQVTQLNGMIDMLKHENTILYTALNRQCLSI